jgi:hypothetical protein
MLWLSGFCFSASIHISAHSGSPSVPPYPRCSLPPIPAVARFVAALRSWRISPWGAACPHGPTRPEFGRVPELWLLDENVWCTHMLASFAVEPRRCRKSLPIRLRRPVIACIPGLDSRNLNYLGLIPFRLARATRAGASPKEAPATQGAGRAASNRRRDKAPGRRENAFRGPGRICGRARCC